MGHLLSAVTPSTQKTPTVNLGQGALVSSAHAGSYALRQARRSPPNWVKPANSKGNWCVGQGRHKGTRRGRGQRSGPPSDHPQWATCTAHKKHATRPPGLRLAATPHPPLGEEMTWCRGGKAGPPGPPWSSVMTLLVVTPDCDAGEATRFPGPNPAHAPSCWRSSGLALLPWPGVGGRCPQGPGCRLCCGRAGMGEAAAPRGSISQPQPRRAPHLVPVARAAGGLAVAKPAVGESPALRTSAVTLTSVSKGSSRPGTIPS